MAGHLLIVSQPIIEPDAIVSLASHEWERLPVAIDAAKQSPAALLLLTKPQRITEDNCHDCLHRVERLVRAGIAADRIRVLALGSGGTYGEALACRQLALEQRLRRILVITSPYHTRRARAVFQRVFAGTDVQVGILPAWAHSPARPPFWWGSAYDRWYVSYEWAATVYYMFRYGVSPAGSSA